MARSDEQLIGARRSLASFVMGCGLDRLSDETRRALGNALIEAANANPTQTELENFRTSIATLLRLIDQDQP